MIYGLPYQAIESWERSLSLILELAADHLSLYALSLEHGTPMQQWVSRGLMAEPDGDLAADMYELAVEKLADAAYSHYEISNWAGSTEAGDVKFCRHNMQYWRLLPYIGFGAGAHGFLSGMHTVNVLSPGVYIQRMQNGEDGEALTGRNIQALTVSTHSGDHFDKQTGQEGRNG